MSSSDETRPWFAMHPQRFLASGKVARMNAEERGVYITLLCRSWMDDGYRMNVRDLADELELKPERLEEILAGRVGRCFQQDADGLWRSERLERERAIADEKRRDISAKRAEAGRRGGKATQSKRKATAKQTEANQATGQDRTEQVASTKQELGTAVPEVVPVGDSVSSEPRSNKRATVSQPELVRLSRAACVPWRAEEALVQWHTYRRSLGKPPVRQTWDMLVAKAAAEPDRFVAQVEHTIAQGWQGLRDPEPTRSPGGATLLTAREQESARRKEAAADITRRIVAGQTAFGDLTQDPQQPRILEAE